MGPSCRWEGVELGTQRADSVLAFFERACELLHRWTWRHVAVPEEWLLVSRSLHCSPSMACPRGVRCSSCGRHDPSVASILVTPDCRPWVLRPPIHGDANAGRSSGPKVTTGVDFIGRASTSGSTTTTTTAGNVSPPDRGRAEVERAGRPETPSLRSIRGWREPHEGLRAGDAGPSALPGPRPGHQAGPTQ
jgi:hypothetical protein